MTTFGNPHEQYTPTTTRSNKERKKVNSNQKDVKTQKKRKSRGQSVNKTSDNTSTAGSSPKPRKKTTETKQKEEEEGYNANMDEENANECTPPNIAFAGFSGLPGFAQIFVTLSAIGQMIVGLIHLFDLFESLEVCDDDIVNYECVGDSLFWEVPYADDTSSSLNFVWRSVFTFAPSGIAYFAGGIFYVSGPGFCDNWTPMIFGLLAVLQMFVSTQWHFISGTWLRTMFFIVVMMLFACFGYSGMVGIIIGFVEVVAGFLCLLCAIFKLGGSPYPTIGY